MNSAFDRLVTPDEQAAWLHRPYWPTERTGCRPGRSVLRHGRHSRFQPLTTEAHTRGFAALLRCYVGLTVPFPDSTELTYWALSSAPSTGGSRYSRLFTLSVTMVETLFVIAPRQLPRTCFVRMNVDLATLLATWGTLNRLTAGNPNLVAYEAGDGARMPAGQAPVASLETYHPGDAIRALRMRGVAAAARRLNLDLMRTGPTEYWRTHCFDLADVALGQ